MTGNMIFGCYSTLPDYKVSTACEVIIPNNDFGTVTTTYLFDGTVVTGPNGTIAATHPMSTRQLTLTRTATSDITAVTIVPFVTLVHKPSDLAPSSTSNAAVRQGSAPSFGGIDVAAVLLVWMAAATLGAAIVMPW